MENEVIFSWVQQEITGYVYCVTFGNPYENPIKIGYATNIDIRIADLQIGNPYSLYVLTVVPGNQQCEAMAHDRLYKYTALSEWFWPIWEVKKFVNHMQKIERAVRDGHMHQIRQVVQAKSGERLVDIIPGIKETDIQVKTMEM